MILFVRLIGGLGPFRTAVVQPSITTVGHKAIETTDQGRKVFCILVAPNVKAVTRSSLRGREKGVVFYPLHKEVTEELGKQLATSG